MSKIDGVLTMIGPNQNGKWRFRYSVNGRLLVSIQTFDDQASARQAGLVATMSDVEERRS